MGKQAGSFMTFSDEQELLVVGAKGVWSIDDCRKNLASFGTDLNAGLQSAGFADTEALFQGSSVTGKSFRTGRPFDISRVSDYDIALAGESIFQKARSLGIPLRSAGTGTGPLTAANLQRLGLSGLASRLESQAGRPVNFMIYRLSSDALLRAPSIIVP